MRKLKRNFIAFDKILLNKLKNEESSGVEVHRSKHHITLHPFHLNDFNKSLKDILDRGVPKYNKDLGGILLGFDNIKLLSDLGVINFDSSFIHLNIEADFYIFRPEVGKELKGIVNKKSVGHVGCLVHNTFNVALPKPEDESNWTGESVQIGYEILFQVTLAQLDSQPPYIKGTIISVLSELDSGISTGEETNSAKNINKKIIFTDEPEADNNQSSQIKKAKKNKRKSKELNEITETPVNTSNSLKKKRKRAISESNDLNEVPNKKIKLENENHKKKKKDSYGGDITSANEGSQEENLSQFNIEHNKHKRKKSKCTTDEFDASDDIELLDMSSIGKISTVNLSSEAETCGGTENRIKGKKKKINKIKNSGKGINEFSSNMNITESDTSIVSYAKKPDIKMLGQIKEEKDLQKAKNKKNNSSHQSQNASLDEEKVKFIDDTLNKWRESLLKDFSLGEFYKNINDNEKKEKGKRKQQQSVLDVSSSENLVNKLLVQQLSRISGASKKSKKKKESQNISVEGDVSSSSLKTEQDSLQHSLVQERSNEHESSVNKARSTRKQQFSNLKESPDSTEDLVNKLIGQQLLSISDTGKKRNRKKESLPNFGENIPSTPENHLKLEMKDSTQDSLVKSLLEEEINIISNPHKAKKKKKHKDKNDSDLDSLPDLNLSSLFESKPLKINKSIFAEMADTGDKMSSSLKRKSWHTPVSNFE